MTVPALTISGLRKTYAGGFEALKGIDLEVAPGQVHAIMGPNGGGKSTLAQVLAGREEYEITEGKVIYKEEDLFEMDPEERERMRGTFRKYKQLPDEQRRQLRKELHERMTSCLRPGDLLASYGPNDYEVLLPDTPAEDAVAIADQLVASVEALKGEGRIGLACFPRDGRTAGALIGVATDRLLGGESDRHVVIEDAAMRELYALAERVAELNAFGSVEGVLADPFPRRLLAAGRDRAAVQAELSRIASAVCKTYERSGS